jgi:hypothetical protein
MEADKGRAQEEKKIVYKVLFHPLFKDDLQNAYDYYESKQRGLGENFLAVVEEALALIQTKPLLFQKIFGHKRKANTRKFPYGIFYSVKKSTVSVFSAFHLHRSPDVWRRRKF